MPTTIDILEQRISDAMSQVAGIKGCEAVVKPSAVPKFGDYQANGVMGLAKQVKANPRKLAEEVVARLDLSDVCEAPEIAGPGFINLRLRPDYVGRRLLRIAADPVRLDIPAAIEPKTVVVDFSSPNVAKEMHVGHLRSTIIGDCICRLLEFEGHRVIRQNHIGDWGTQFGMLLALLDGKSKYTGKHTDVALHPPELTDLPLFVWEEWYREAKQRHDADATFSRQSRDWVVKLQQGDLTACNYWQMILNYSLLECQGIYDRLGVALSQKDVRGESFYNPMLAAVVQDLKSQGLAKESEGAICVFPPGFKTKDDQPLPFIVQKSDGAFLYATTDLAAIRYRVGELKADRIVYVTDSRQKLHFEMLFATARKAGWAPQQVELAHVMFGSVLGEDGTPLKTRSGESVKLKELLDEAVQRARSVVEQKNPDLPADKKAQIAKAVGIGAVKYADYSNNRTSDYVFSFDRMLAMDGNTAPYMQYAYARVRSIERKAVEKGVDVKAELAGLPTGQAGIGQVSLTEPDELALAKHLIRYGEAIEKAIADYRPNNLTAYLYELAQCFSSFYTNCPVLDAESGKRRIRLVLCDLTAKTIRYGLGLLGIAVVEVM